MALRRAIESARHRQGLSFEDASACLVRRELTEPRRHSAWSSPSAQARLKAQRLPSKTIRLTVSPRGLGQGVDLHWSSVDGCGDGLT